MYHIKNKPDWSESDSERGRKSSSEVPPRANRTSSNLSESDLEGGRKSSNEMFGMLFTRTDRTCSTDADVETSDSEGHACSHSEETSGTEVEGKPSLDHAQSAASSDNNKHELRFKTLEKLRDRVKGKKTKDRIAKNDRVKGKKTKGHTSQNLRDNASNPEDINATVATVIKGVKRRLGIKNPQNVSNSKLKDCGQLPEDTHNQAQEFTLKPCDENYTTIGQRSPNSSLNQLYMPFNTNNSDDFTQQNYWTLEEEDVSREPKSDEVYDDVDENLKQRLMRSHQNFSQDVDVEKKSSSDESSGEDAKVLPNNDAADLLKQEFFRLIDEKIDEKTIPLRAQLTGMLTMVKELKGTVNSISASIGDEATMIAPVGQQLDVMNKTMAAMSSKLDTMFNMVATLIPRNRAISESDVNPSSSNAASLSQNPHALLAVKESHAEQAEARSKKPAVPPRTHAKH